MVSTCIAAAAAATDSSCRFHLEHTELAVRHRVLFVMQILFCHFYARFNMICILPSRIPMGCQFRHDAMILERYARRYEVQLRLPRQTVPRLPCGPPEIPKIANRFVTIRDESGSQHRQTQHKKKTSG